MLSSIASVNVIKGVLLLLLWFAGVSPVGAEPLAIDIPLTSGAAPADMNTLAVRRGDELVLRWTSDTELELHLHGYDIAARVGPGAPTEMRVVAEFTGRFLVSAHVAGGHRNLLYLEVHPR